ncbi:hypothetical protein AKJ40_01765 [candidate division MSBL1 archaeon SCGC-AAA259M10]|uniref:Uncharacterized protein n=1 Tax=candidate division MSBL1 archaeon SCGC-AAA259M10 TaxID=1698270 RepID=A0A133V178_9EURY|nr:hypothetical protein AKJ40_01765 [candidate division MSBL1 archaeon SCGC-AAA259M10]
MARTAKDEMLDVEKTVDGEAEYEIDSHETVEGNLKVEITVKEPNFTAEVEDPEISEIEDPEPGDVTTPYDYAHNELDTDGDFANKLRKGLEKIINGAGRQA